MELNRTEKLVGVIQLTQRLADEAFKLYEEKKDPDFLHGVVRAIELQIECVKLIPAPVENKP